MQKKIFSSLIAFFAAATLVFCQNEEAVGVAPQPYVDWTSVGKVKKIDANGKIYFDNNATRQVFNFNEGHSAVFFMTRHAEKQPETAANPDPELTDAGTKRAKLLAKILHSVHLRKVSSTDTRRTKATARPTASDQNLVTEIYSFNAQENYVAGLIANGGRGRKHLLVGHANTVSPLVNYLIGTPLVNDLNSFDNLFIVVVPSVGNGRVFHVKY